MAVYNLLKHKILDKSYQERKVKVHLYISENAVVGRLRPPAVLLQDQKSQDRQIAVEHNYLKARVIDRMRVIHLKYEHLICLMKAPRHYFLNWAGCS